VELFNVTVEKDMSLGPSMYFEMMRTGLLMAHGGHLPALDDVAHVLARMDAIGETDRHYWNSSPTMKPK
jgi:hypothetical protein